MVRRSGKWAAIWWGGCLAIPSNALAQGNMLPTVEIVAPRHRQDARPGPKRSASPGRRSSPTANLRPSPTGTAAAAPGTTGAGSAPVSAASEKNVSGAAVNARPLSRPAEALEVVPGLIVTQHSGDGKANQYFLRGFNLDHGTDLAISVDDMPVNMRTHAHGQGYADLNFLIPELIGSVNIRKGPYFADEGDFSSVGSVHVALLDSIRSMASMTVGSFGYQRVFSAAPRASSATARCSWPARSTPITDHGTIPTLAQAQRDDAVQPGHGGGRFFADRHGLCRQVEFHRPDSGACDRLGGSRPLRRDRSQ